MARVGLLKPGKENKVDGVAKVWLGRQVKDKNMRHPSFIYMEQPTHPGEEYC